MFGKSGSYRHKNQARVILTLAGQEPFEAWVFVKVEERLIDLLNDDRAFIPVRRTDGATVITAKTNIVSIVECDAPVSNEDPAEEASGELEGNDAIAQKDAEPDDAHSPALEDEKQAPPAPEAEAITKTAAEEKDAAEAAAKEETDKSEAEKEAAAKEKRKQESEQPEPSSDRRRFDPYKFLRVSPDASIDDVRKAYKARIKAVHPDTIAALDLDEDIERAVNLTAQKVNRAYKQILRDREQDKAEAAENAAPEEERKAGAA